MAGPMFVRGVFIDICASACRRASLRWNSGHERREERVVRRAEVGCRGLSFFDIAKQLGVLGFCALCGRAPVPSPQGTGGIRPGTGWLGSHRTETEVGLEPKRAGRSASERAPSSDPIARGE